MMARLIVRLVMVPRYQGVDWRHPGNARCNMQQDPAGNYALDGVTVLPYEVMFLAMDAALAQDDTAAVYAQHYTDWLGAV